jgi:ABC-type lipoprotein release transport system permease subunit
MTQLVKMAFRDIGRNKRRSALSALAVSLGTALLLFVAAMVSGEMQAALQNAIRLQSGHLQVRAASYEESKSSLAWDDLVENPDRIVAQLHALPQVAAATPRLVANGILSRGEESRGMTVIGLDQAGPNQVFRQGLLAGEFLGQTDRDGI